MAQNPSIGGAAIYVGVDYHKGFSVATRMDEKGKILQQVRLSNDPQTLTRFVDHLPSGSKIALEATGSWYYFYELLENRCRQIYLAHPLKTRAIAEARIKTDKIDSTILAHLLRANLLPTSYIPPREIREFREILRYRASLVALRTSIKNKVHAILSKNGISMEYSDLLGKKALAYLRGLKLRSCYQLGIQGYLRLGETLSLLMEEISQTIQRRVEENPRRSFSLAFPASAAILLF